MPEITSVAEIRRKLKEFDHRVDVATLAAQSVVHARDDAEKLLGKLKRDCEAGAKSAKVIDQTRVELNRSKDEWNQLKQEVLESQAESKNSWTELTEKLEASMRSLDGHVNEAKEEIRAEYETALLRQADLLHRLDADIRANADRAEKASQGLAKKSEELNRLLMNVRDELKREVDAGMNRVEKRLTSSVDSSHKDFDAKLQATTQVLNEQGANLGHYLRTQMSEFKEEMKRVLTEHQAGVDRQVTEFLNKQNALVQNLALQIDGYQRAAQTLTDDHHHVKAQLMVMSKYVEQSRSESSQMRAFVKVLKSELDTEKQETSRRDNSVSELSARLDSIFQVLVQLPMFGSRFKDL